jgi:hypothetical protein
MHRAAIDGVMGVDLMTEIFDLERHPEPSLRPSTSRHPSGAVRCRAARGCGDLDRAAASPAYCAVRNLTRSAVRGAATSIEPMSGACR